ncbi:hypothetical protein EZV76_05225 [Flagellimonas alvinocaridis]|uniref:DUF4488 domain-containing protein n=1 Tax=Flagellimonas alvinocaridis TaxID=2530200 RepID=A0A4S8RN18_9FLAO|nr:hypothetical protein [Allomuricauda alvinocaridis]THV59963.1 hypothetical protein EZV76_05225 [Allomuricauda alvinocaridis]
MKRLLIIFFIVPLMSMTIENDRAKFVGKWIGEDKKEIGYLNFDSEGYAFFEIQGQVFGGKEFIFDGKKGKMTYEINSDTNPIEVDLIVTKLESGEQKKLLCIAQFIDNDTMKFAISFEEKRATEFDTENSIIFKREK